MLWNINDRKARQNIQERWYLLLEYKLFLDTNALLNLQSAAFKEKFVISQKTLEEIESIKTSGHKDGDVKYKARSIARLLDQSENYEVIAYTPEVRKIINDFK